MKNILSQVGEIRDYEATDYVKACRKFQQEVEEEGYFETSYTWYFMKTSVSYCMLAITIYLFLKGKATQNEWIQVSKH